MSKHQVNEIEEATPGAGVTITGLKAPGFKAPQNAFATTAERDAFFAGLLTGNEIAFNSQTGFVERYNAPTAEWRPEGVTGSAGPITRSKSRGAKGDDANTATDRTAILEADAVAAASGGFVEHDPGTYRFLANTTLAARHNFNGAKFKSAGGVTVTFSSFITGPHATIFDYSLGGNYAFTRQLEFDVEWFGPPTNGTDAGVILTKMSASIPDYSRVKFNSTNVIYALTTTWESISKKGVTFTTGLDARIPDNGAPTFWYTGPAHGRAIVQTRCKNCFFSGLRVVLGGSSADGSPAGITDAGADRGLSLEGHIDGDIGTQSTIEYCSFLSLVGSDDIVQCGIAEFSGGQNHEYHNIRNNSFTGWGHCAKWANLSVNAGTDIVNAGGGNPFNNQSRGQRIIILGAGAAGAHLTTTIIAVLAGNQVQIAVNAGTTVVGVAGFIGQTYGTAIRFFPSANVKGINVDHNNINQFSNGLRKNGGSYRMQNNSFYDNELDIWNEGNGEPEYEIGTEVEFSRKHFKGTILYTHWIMGGRFDVQMILPDTSYFASDFICLPLEGIKTENQQTAGINATITDAKKRFDAGGGMYLYHFEHCIFADGGQTIDTIAGGPNYGVTVEKCTNFFNGSLVLEPSQDLITQRSMFYGFGQPVTRHVLNADPAFDVGAHVSQIWYTSGGGGGHRVPCYRAEFYPVADHANLFQKIPVGFETKFRGVFLTFGGHPYQLIHFSARTPTWAAGSTGYPAETIGFHSEPQANALGGKAYGNKQDGVNDINRYEGRSYLATPNSAPTDAEIPPGGYSAYLNEAGNLFTVRVKYTDGVTMKTGTFALV